MPTVLQELINEVLQKQVITEQEVDRLKKAYAKKYKMPTAPHYQLLEAYKSLLEKHEIKQSKKLETVLRKRKIRTLSGVAPLAVLTKPFPCPGKCTFCPESKDAPKSYHPLEPAVMRAIRNDYDPYRQARSRLEMLERNGHCIEKIELIIVGGTFSSYPKSYQKEFIKRCFDALNTREIAASSLEEAQKINETAKCRCVAFSVETRPDYISEEELKRLRIFGCTKVEIGLQSTYDDVLEKVKRGHNVACVKETIQKLKDAGFKINLHTMPNLPGSTPQRDIQMYNTIFDDPAFRPDHLKIYPCMIVKDTELYEQWRRGEYEPYSEKELMEVLLKIKPNIPRYIRIVRVTRDIPTSETVGGTRTVNFRQLLHQEMEKRNIRCNCIRCREIRDEAIFETEIELRKLEFPASLGKEYFLSYDHIDKDKICSLLRLRIPSQVYSGQKHFIPELEGASIIRELHTYGNLVPLENKEEGASQHIGLGKKLVQEAEAITKKEGLKKIAVIAGIGVREYYRKLGYKLEGTYMVREL